VNDEIKLSNTFIIKIFISYKSKNKYSEIKLLLRILSQEIKKIDFLSTDNNFFIINDEIQSLDK